MLILLPPSEGKTAPDAGPVLDLGSLWEPSRLEGARRTVMAELAAVSAGPKAPSVLGLGPRSADDVMLNLVLEQAPCAPAYALYTGVLFDAAQMPLLGSTPAAREVLSREVIVFSGLWGAVRATDRLPDHRLSMSVSLPATGRLASFWRPRLAQAVSEVADGVVVDCRSGAYSPAWQPERGTESQLLGVRVVSRRPDGGYAVVSHRAKHARGLLAGALVRARAQGLLPQDAGVDDVVALAAEIQGVRGTRLSEADSRGRRELTLVT
ncbi:YaaA family protein [Actinomyces faecalis]|uniref:YaaA family protein n=1 Tax=Actinomyces faecalis TaxID=2722820 RepID=UPI0015518128|nr:peroxide stress protein YaaA [Actinomyces faecalis]